MKNKVFGIILSVLISFGLWLYVITVISPESEKTYYEIPVILQNENILAERGLMITSEIPRITLQLMGNRSDLNSLNESNINILTSVSGIVAPGEHLLSYSIAYPGHIPSNAIEEKHRSIDLIPLVVENKLTKRVPVIVNYVGTVPNGYIADKENAVLDYTEIQISGPESVVNLIAQACIQVDLEGRDETFAEQYEFTLCNEQGEAVNLKMVTANTQTVNLSIQIQRYMDLELFVDVVDGGGATKDTCTINIIPKVIRVSGNEAYLEKIGPINLGTINLGELLNDQTLKFPIVLPDEVTNQTGVTEAAVEVKFPLLKTKSFNVTNIVPVNVPEGLEVEMITQALEVKVRGPIALVDLMRESDISVTVDFSGAQIGTTTMKAYISISSRFSQVGALNTYSVSATLREPVEELLDEIEILE